MPNALAKPCQGPGCCAMLPCARHPRFLHRPTVRARYDATWEKLRSMKLARNPMCGQAGCVTPFGGGRPLHVHHIIDVAERPELRLDLDNLMTLCHSCHSRITMKDHPVNATGQSALGGLKGQRSL